MKNQVEDDNLRLIVFNSFKEQGQMIDSELLDMYGLNKDKYTFIIPIKEVFFEDGHLKVEIEKTVRGKDVFFLTDIGNYNVTYPMHGFINHASPNDLFVQLKDGIYACNNHATSVNIVMPLLYNGRQHKKQTRESLSCGEALRELDSIKGIKSFISFDVHDQGVEHAVHNMEFDNFFVSNTILDKFIKTLSLDELKRIVFVAPDNGATNRRDVYLNSFYSPYINRDAGGFIKKRDYNTFEDGKYKIISHDFLGPDDLEGQTMIISDDMISSGQSLVDVIEELKKRHAGHVYAISTYALFTKGVQEFERLYKEKKLDGIYTSNLSYIPEEYKKCEWLHVCDCSKDIANIIYNIHNDLSISEILGDKSPSIKLLEKKFKGEL